MADMFYFRSPTRPPSSKCWPDLRHKLKVCKRRRCAKMDDQIQRACVAQLDEPVFCASSLASVISHHGFGSCVTDDSHPGSSGTQKQGCNGNTAYAGHSGTLPTSLDQVDDISHQTPFPEEIHYSRLCATNILRQDSESRTQLALEDTSESTLLIPRLLHLLGVEHSWSPESDTDNLTAQSSTGSLSRSTYLSPVIQGLATYVYETDDDAFAVDDPRRSYDFKDFMHNWHRNEDVSHHRQVAERDLASFLHVDHDDVDRTDVESGEIDIQGLRWNEFGFRRDQVIGSRKLHHPSHRTRLACPESRTMHLKPPETLPYAADTQYRFQHTTLLHRAKYSHYQLRNVLAATSRSEIFYATGSQVIKTALGAPTMETTAMDLTKNSPSHSPVRITCLSATATSHDGSNGFDRVLLAGGFDGEYAMLDIAADGEASLHTGFVNHDYNGLVTHVGCHADRRSGALRACFCSNDRKVRNMDIKTQRFISAFAYENAANCSALSSDGRLRVLVGDSNETLITDADRGDILVTMKEHTEHGFACAWSEDSRSVATGAEDGIVVLWDSRNWSRPVRTMQCAVATARSLHFTSDSALVVAEDDDFVTIHDTRREGEKQEIGFFGSIAGMALIDGGEEMVVANIDATVGGLLSWQRSPQNPSSGLSDKAVSRDAIRERRSQYRRAVVRDFMSRESESRWGLVV
jgi:hypothetical protein